jgi:hypothetical protein
VQVDQHVETLRVRFQGQEDALVTDRLARKGLKPQQITLVGGYTNSLSSAMEAWLATEQHHPMFQRVQRMTFQGSFPMHLPQVSGEPPGNSDESVCHCEPAWLSAMLGMPVWLASYSLCCQQTHAQGMFGSMPRLAHLVIRQQLRGQNAQMFTAAGLGRLHSLDVHMDLCHAGFLKGCTQLKGATLLTSNLKGVSVIAQLTVLTQLELSYVSPSLL